MPREINNKLTLTQEKVLLFCAETWLRDNYFPTLRGLAKEFGWSSNVAGRDHLMALTKKGYAEYIKYCGFRLTDLGWQYSEVAGIFGSFCE